MPDPQNPEDKIFQISCILYRFGDEESQMRNFLLSLGDPDEKIVGENTTVIRFESEYNLLLGFTEFINKHAPNIISGYNILGFDVPYMIERAKVNYCFDVYNNQGFLDAHANESTIKWTSSAYGTQEFQFLDAEGRLFIDLLPLVKRAVSYTHLTLPTKA